MKGEINEARTKGHRYIGDCRVVWTRRGRKLAIMAGGEARAYQGRSAAEARLASELLAISAAPEVASTEGAWAFVVGVLDSAAEMAASRRASLDAPEE